MYIYLVTLILPTGKQQSVVSANDVDTAYTTVTNKVSVPYKKYSCHLIGKEIAGTQIPNIYLTGKTL